VTTCTTMRSTVLLSLGLLVAGVLLLLLERTTGFGVGAAYAALWLVLGGAGTLAAAFLIAVWPGNQARLDGCRH